MPNLCRSWGMTCAISSSSLSSTLRPSSALKPMPFLPMRSATSLSRPTKAPPQMKRMLVVSMRMSSCWGCLRPPWGGTLASVPSRILSSACCTPSPETSRVIERFSALRAILSISSMYTMPICARSTSPSAAVISLSRMFSTSSPTYPASVRVVASAMAKGTSRKRARVCASRVLPVPVGPSSRMLDFAISTSSLPSGTSSAPAMMRR